VLDNVCGYSTVFLRGTSPAFILKEASSAPRVIGLHGKAVKGLTRFHTSACQRGFAYIDAQVSTIVLLVYRSTNSARTHFEYPNYLPKPITDTWAGRRAECLWVPKFTLSRIIQKASTC
jgi:hypothetical protein